MTWQLSRPRRFLSAALCLALLLIGSSSRPARGDDKPSGLSKEKLDGITAVIKDGVAKKQFVGGSALIARHGKVVHVTTVGMQDAEGKVPLTEKTIFRIASMSKPITSVAIMMLVEDGQLAVTDPLSKFVPEFKEMKVLVPSADGKSFETVKAARAITIHDLLTHTSGISYGLLDKPFVAKMYAEAGVSDGLMDTPGTTGDNIRKLAKMPLVCQPGAAWEYGLNTDVLGYVVEVVSGKSLEEFCSERIFKPLKMNDTGFLVPKDKRSRLTALFKGEADKSLVNVTDKPEKVGAAVFTASYPTRDGAKFFSGGAGMVSTLGDYFRFCQMMLNRGELDGVRVLKAETVDKMTKNQLGELRIMFPGNDLMGYGFGVLSEKGKETSKDPAGVGTYAWGGAFGTYFWVDPKNELIGVFMSQVFPPDFALGMKVKQLAYEALTEGKK